MKYLGIISIIICGTLLSLCTSICDEDKLATVYKTDSIEILNILKEESKAFWDKDFEKYSQYWAHEDYIRTAGWWATGGITIVEGWEERSNRTKQHMELSANPNINATEVVRKNINLRLFKDVAWLTFDQYGVDTQDTLMDMAGLSRETRIFEKLNGQWKIVYVGWLLEGE